MMTRGQSAEWFVFLEIYIDTCFSLFLSLSPSLSLSLLSLFCLSSVSLLSLFCLSSVSLLSLFCLSSVSLLSLFCLFSLSLLSLFSLSLLSLSLSSLSLSSLSLSSLSHLSSLFSLSLSVSLSLSLLSLSLARAVLMRWDPCRDYSRFIPVQIEPMYLWSPVPHWWIYDSGFLFISILMSWWSSPLSWITYTTILMDFSENGAYPASAGWSSFSPSIGFAIWGTVEPLDQKQLSFFWVLKSIKDPFWGITVRLRVPSSASSYFTSSFSWIHAQTQLSYHVGSVLPFYCQYSLHDIPYIISYNPLYAHHIAMIFHIQLAKSHCIPLSLYLYTIS